MKIICVGRNYAKHIAELNSELPEELVFFLKPESALLRKNVFFIPDFSNEIHYEIEIVLRISRLGKHINRKFAHRYYDAIALGIDFTARDIQNICKQKGLPWEKAKAFDGSAFISDFIPLTNFENLEQINFSLYKNGILVQNGCTSNMLYKFDDIIENVSKFMTLKIGDVIFTGTPEGVGPVIKNDILEGFIENQKMFRIKIK